MTYKQKYRPTIYNEGICTNIAKTIGKQVCQVHGIRVPEAKKNIKMFV